MQKKLTCLLAACCWLFHLMAQPNYPAPSGVYCSCPPTTGSGNGSVLPAVAAKAYVKGILVRVGWKDLEPNAGTYNWSLVDGQISAANIYGKKISLAIGSGPNSPPWLYAAGASSLSFTLPFSGSIPVPWDSTFLHYWTRLADTLGKRYRNDTTVQLVYITNSSQNGFEMQIPFNPSPSYNAIGYSDDRMIASWKQVIDAFRLAFPNHYLTNDFHPVNGSNNVGDSAYAYAKQQLPQRYGANGWWWTQNNTAVYPVQFSILQQSGSSDPFTGIQMANSGINNAASFGTGGMPYALGLAITNHISYWELWNGDITDGSFDSLLSQAATDAVWQGTIDSNWHEAANWSTGIVPTGKTHVSIPAATPHPCQVFLPGAEAARLQLYPGALLQVNETSSLSIARY